MTRPTNPAAPTCLKCGHPHMHSSGDRWRCPICLKSKAKSGATHGGARVNTHRNGGARAGAGRKRKEVEDELSRVVGESNAAFEPLLAKLSLPVKMELYKAIYSDAANMSEEVLTLGVALTSDPAVQNWLSMAFRR